MDEFVYKKIQDIYKTINSSNRENPITNRELLEITTVLGVLLEMYKPVEEQPRKTLRDFFR